VVLLLWGDAASATTFDVAPYLQDAREDGAVIAWEAQPPAPGEVEVEVGGARRVFASPAGVRHEVRVSGLPPGTWRYRAGSGTARARGELTTAAAGDQPFTFLVYGDSRDALEQHARTVAAMHLAHADLVLNTGDLVAEGGSERQWLRFFEIEEPLLRATPLYPAPGNHEYLGDPTLAHFRRFFVLPSPPPVLAEHGAPLPVRLRHVEPGFYSFRYGNSLFVALDANRPEDAEQTAWLAATLLAAERGGQVRHVFAFFHQPPFAVGDQCGQAPRQGPWVSELAFHKVRAVFSGHIHAYEHLERDGVRYFVSGGAGAGLDRRLYDCAPYDQGALVAYRSVSHFLRVQVRGAQVLLAALGPDGELYDSLRLDEPGPQWRASPRVPYAMALPHPLERRGPCPRPPRLSRARARQLLALFSAVLIASLWWRVRRASPPA
jgi:hypothetical protein